MKILFLSCHEILEFDEVSLFNELELDVFSPGAYVEPDNPGGFSLRPGIPDLVYDKKELEMFHALGKLGINNKELLTKEFVDNFDVVMVMHIPKWITKNWEAIKDKIVIWRTIGQSTSNVEAILAPYRKKGLKIVRYSEAERTIPNYIGEDAVIRFYKDPDELKDWNGNTEQIINVTQSMHLRRVACNYDMFLRATDGFQRKLFGHGNETIGDVGSGPLTYDELKEQYRNNRAYFYTGTHPASYTLNFIEAFMCFPPNENVITLNGAKEIKSIREGEKLREIDQKENNVLSTFHRSYEGEIMQIKGLGMFPILTTPDHPIATINAIKRYSHDKWKKKLHCYEKVIGEIKFKAAQSIKKGDYLVFPKLRGEIKEKILTLSYKRKTCPSKQMNTIPLNKETARLFGYYLAEGACGCGVHIYFGKTETTLINDVKNIAEKNFPYKVSVINIPHNGVSINFGGSAISRFLKKEFGEISLNKKIPEWLLFGRIELLKEFLIGYMRGDGYIEKRKTADYPITRLHCSTSSLMLALHLQQAFSRFGIFVTLTHDKREGRIKIRNTIVNQKDRYLIHLNNPSYTRFFGIPLQSTRLVKRYLEDENNFYVPVTKIENRKYKGLVYNLRTSTGMYQVSNILVHNCGVPIVAIGPGHGNMPSRPDCANLYEIPNIITNRENGFYSDDIQELRDFIQILMNDKNYAKTISRNGRRRAIELFGKEKIKQQWKVFWEGLKTK